MSTVGDLEALTEPGTVMIGGRIIKVNPIDGYGYKLLGEAERRKDEPGTEALEIMYRVAARCLAPHMTREEVIGDEDTSGISAEEVGTVIAAAQVQVKKVEELASPNSAPAGLRGTKSSRKG